MTLKERVIVETYTGYCMTSGEERNEVYKYMQEIMERPVCTHELASKEIQQELHEKSKDDFVNLCRNQKPDFDVYELLIKIKGIGKAHCCRILCNGECPNCDHSSMMQSILDTIRKAVSDGKIN